MAIRLSNGFKRFSHGWVALLALAIFCLFTALVLPAQSSQAEENSGGTGSPDTSLFYTPGELINMTAAYGPQGRAAYVRARFTFDLIWPLVYTFFLVTTISWVYARVFTPGSPLQLANLVPVLGLLFDYLENISTSLVMLRYPNPTLLAAWLAPFFTLLKWVFVGGSFIVLLTGVVTWIIRRISSSS